jgi:hypothetical protein
MPILTYFAVAGSLLLAVLLAVSAYLDPAKAPTAAEFFGVHAANADSRGVQPVMTQDDLPEVLRLKRLPLNR